MNVAAPMLEARPDARGVDHAALAVAIDALNDVVIAATTCGDSCLSDPGDSTGTEDTFARICADTTSRAQQALAGLQPAIAAAASGS